MGSTTSALSHQWPLHPQPLQVESLPGQEALLGICELVHLSQECWEAPVAWGFVVLSHWDNASGPHSQTLSQ